MRTPSPDTIHGHMISERLLPILLLGMALSAAACASRGRAVPQPFPTPRGDGPPTATAPNAPNTPGIDLPAVASTLPIPSVIVQSLLATAMHLVGTPYRNGGTDPDGFDCSGFVYYVFAQQGVFVPRTVVDQAGVGSRVGDVRAGDLVFFRTSGRGPTHVGIALGPDRFVHAPSARGEVRIEPLARPYWADRFLEARRVF
jgi:cell wall-associated NlpC family hydrolase